MRAGGRKDPPYSRRGRADCWWLVICGAFGIAAVAAAWLSLRPVWRDRTAMALAEAPRQVGCPAAFVMGPRLDFRGDPRAPVTLVEFGDYQCAPCAAANRRIGALLSAYPHRVRLLFRNLPLTRIHARAMAAAIAAEAAGTRRVFWAVHDGLYTAQGHLGPATVRRILDAAWVPPPVAGSPIARVARAAVDDDMRAAVRLGVNATPTFFLCLPDGRVIGLGSIEQAASFVTG